MNLVSENIIIIPDFLTHKECDQLIVLSETHGYDEATVETEKGSKMLKDVRNNERLLWKDEIHATELWKRVRQFVPAKIGNSVAVGLNELFRFYKYGPGQLFKKHIDESFIRNEYEASYLTFLIYLNDDYAGGETKFNDKAIKGKKGEGLIFLHSLPHEGAEVTAGFKYVLRTDIMYRLEEKEFGTEPS